MDIYCNNCGKKGHILHHCKMPIISLGVIAYTVDEDDEYRFLMIRRKDTLGYMDFIRGKYSIYNKEYIVNLLDEMTLDEKSRLLQNDFDTLWKLLWHNSNIALQYKYEQESSREKFNALVCGIMTQSTIYTLAELVNASTSKWEEPEWGFPKGRRNHNENDADCAFREFTEETGYATSVMKIVENIQPFEEIFMGSNLKSYKHKYYLMRIDRPFCDIQPYDKNEVSKVEWKTYEQCLACIRPYNLEKKKLINNVMQCLTQYIFTA